MRRIYKTGIILFGLLGLYAIPAQSQIVSYRDDTGKMVYINADPKPVKRAPERAKSSQNLVPGFKTIAAQPMASPSSMSALSSSSTLSASNAIAQPQSEFQSKSQSTASHSSDRDPNQTIVQSSRADIAQMVREVSSRYHVDPELIEAVVQTESHGNPFAVSNRGAQGLMQLVPETAYQMGVKDPLDPRQNLDGGVHYLQTLLERYNGNLDKALAAYNAGPGAVDRAGGVPQYRETRDYVQKVTNSYYRPGSDRLPTAFTIQERIYRAVDTDGRVVFTNE